MTTHGSVSSEVDRITAPEGRSGPRTVVRRPCLWCILYRPGCAPNLVETAVKNSDGICPECGDAFRGKRK